MSRFTLWVIKRLLWWADALICRLPTPDAARGAYFDEWGRLSDVHGAICAAYEPLAPAQGPTPAEPNQGCEAG